MKRKAQVDRKTRETNISISLTLDGRGKAEARTPVTFFNHLLETFALHGRFDLRLQAQGDIAVDPHHLIEDCGLTLGEAFRRALGNSSGIQRAGHFLIPMDEALALVAVDLGGRPFLQYQAAFRRRFCGAYDTDLTADFFQALASRLNANIVVQVLAGRSDHHKLEAVFKAFGRALRLACQLDSRAAGEILSLKGVIGDDRHP